MIRGFGYLPDPNDDRDRLIGDLLGALAESPPPASGSVRNDAVGPKDQGGTNSCTGQAIAQGLRLSFLAAGVPCPELSALHNYYHGRAEWGGQRVDDGSYLRTGVKAAQYKGIPVEVAYPFDEAAVNRRPTWLAEQRAWDRRGLRGYYRIVGSAEGVRRAIAAGHAVVGGWKVDEAFLDYAGIGVIDVPRGRIVGSHAVALEDFAADGTFGLLNSWGMWGRMGRARVTERWVESGSDLWALVVRP